MLFLNGRPLHPYTRFLALENQHPVDRRLRVEKRLRWRKLLSLKACLVIFVGRRVKHQVGQVPIFPQLHLLSCR